MASKQQRLQLHPFKGINSGTLPHLVEQGEFIEAENVEFVDGEVVGVNNLLRFTSEEIATPFGYSHPVFFKVYTKFAPFGATKRYRNEAYLVGHVRASGAPFFTLVDPDDLENSVNLFFVNQTLFPYNLPGGTLVDAKQDKCLITGWKHDTLDGINSLEIQAQTGDPTYFQFNVGSGWSTASTSAVTTTGTNITVGGDTLTVYFKTTSLPEVLTATGNNTWKWDKTIQTFPNVCALNYDIRHTYIGDTLVFIFSGKVFYFNGYTVVSVGYKPLMGTDVKNFFNHLVVARPFEQDSFVNPGYGAFFSDIITPYRFFISDLNSIHDFTAEQNNEADEYVLPSENSSPDSSVGIMGMEIWNDALYIFTNTRVYRVDYVGLPLVIRITELGRAASCLEVGCSCETPYGVALINNAGEFGMFNGSEFTRLGQKFDNIFAERKYAKESVNNTLAYTFFFAGSYFYITSFRMFYDDISSEIVFRDNTVNPAGSTSIFEYRYSFNNGFSVSRFRKEAAASIGFNYLAYQRSFKDFRKRLYLSPVTGSPALLTSYDATDGLTYVATEAAFLNDIVLITGDIHTNTYDYISFEKILLDVDYVTANSVTVYYSVRRKLTDDITWVSIGTFDNDDDIPRPIQKGGRIWRFKIVANGTAAVKLTNFRLRSMVLFGTGFDQNVEK